MSKKRERSINFTRGEIDILIKLVKVNKHILANKKSDAVTWIQKAACWKAIEASFNAASGSTHRTSKNLRLKYEGLKRDIRRKSAIISTETHHTGPIGPRSSTAPNRSFEKVSDPKIDITVLQRQILEEEYENKRRRWAFEEEERHHKREIWALEKKVLLRKLDELSE